MTGTQTVVPPALIISCLWFSIGSPAPARILIQAATLQWAPPDVEAFVRESIQDRMRAGDIPDLNLVIRAGARRIAIREDMPAAGLKLSSSALPRGEAWEFALISLADTQATADQTGESVYFIAVDRPRIDGTSATIDMGGDFTMPADSAAVKLCCCEGRAHYVQNGGRWTFLKWEPLGCR